MYSSKNSISTFLFPVITELKSLKRYGSIEQLAFDHYYRMGYKRIGFENEPIADIFLNLCFNLFLLKPDWTIWNKNKSVKDYPILLDSQQNKEKFLRILNSDGNISLDWCYSDECLWANGNPLYFPNGVHYQIHKNKIDDFINNELPQTNIVKLMKNNSKKIAEMRKKYSTLFIWGRIEGIDNLETITNSIPINLLQYIIRELFRHFYKNRIGFPDCWLWNEEKQHLKLVEVKRITEQIMPHQVRWLNKFYENGIDVSVMRINLIRQYIPFIES